MIATSSARDGGPATRGPLLFARYADPQKALGYCGDRAPATLFELASEAPSDASLVELARGFEGAWPYLELIAAAAGIDDPLAPVVVEAYWLGNPLLDRVDRHDLARHLDGRFGRRTGRSWNRPGKALPRGALPHHNFHVFCVCPWVRQMQAGDVEDPLRVVDRCRIRWGTVESLSEGSAVVRTHRLVWAEGRLKIGPEEAAPFMWRAGDRGPVEELSPGDDVSLHWDWICDRIEPWQAAQLSHYTRRILTVANAGPSLAT
jgi:hypothetical protein